MTTPVQPGADAYAGAEESRPSSAPQASDTLHPTVKPKTKPVARKRNLLPSRLPPALGGTRRVCKVTYTKA